MEKYLDRLEETKDLNGILIEVKSIKKAIANIIDCSSGNLTFGKRLNLIRQKDELEEELKQAEEVQKNIIEYYNRVNNLLLKD